MRQRAIILAIAVFLGLTAAFMVSSYANKAKTAALANIKTVKVLTAVAKLPVGLSLDALRARKLVEIKKVPKEFVAEGALKPSSKLDDKMVLASSLVKGEQLTKDKFKVAKEAGLAFTIPPDMIAVAIPIDDMKAAGNLIRVGDLVNVVGTAKNIDGKEMTKTILQKVRVLAVGTSLENSEKQNSSVGSLTAAGEAQKTSRTVTLALSQEEAEKLIFMQDQGRIWLTLLPSSKAAAVSTSGQTIETVFK